MKILVSDKIKKKGIEKLKNVGKVDIKTKLDQEELKDIIKEYEAIIVRSGTTLDRDILEMADNLKVIGRAGVGVDNIDIDAATEKGIFVINAPEASTISVSEHTVGLIFSMARNIPQANMSLKKGKWEKNKFLGEEVRGKKLGIIGLGRIGSEVSKMAKKIGMDVAAHDPYISDDVVDGLGIEMKDVEEIIKESDFLTFHVPLTKETEHMISKNEFKAMKKNAIILNVARGGIVDEEALTEAIKEGEIGGAALDVFEEEPPFGSPLLTMDNVVLTPHLGASTKEAQESVAESIADQVISTLKGVPVENVINVPKISPSNFKRLSPFISLAEDMGKFLAQLSDQAIKKIEVRIEGSLTEENTEPIKISALKGFLNVILQEPVNFVNAPVVAKNRGIEIIESRTDDSKEYKSLLTITVDYNGDERKISGSIFGKDDKRIVNIDNYKMDTSISGYMLYTKHLDMPGVVGTVGGILGDYNVNIGSMQVGRAKNNGEAIMLMNVDEKIPENAILNIKDMDKIKEIKQIKV